MMSINVVRSLYVVFCFGLCMVVISPALMMVIPPYGERFSELWLLGEEGIAEGYPSLVVPENDYRLFVGVGNHMGGSHHYLVVVKLGNQTQLLPDPSISKASPLPSLYEFRFFLQEDATWESPVVFAFHNVTREGNTLYVGGFSINDFDFLVDYVSARDSEKAGFYFQLFFELWHFNVTSQDFEFHNRFVKIWLNMIV